MLARVSRCFCMVLALSVSVLALSACATSDSGTNPVKQLAVMTGVATELPPAADFVAASRTETLEFMPVGVMPLPPVKPVAARTPEELAALEAELEAARLANEAAAAAQQ